MSGYTQSGRAMALTTPLGKDVLLLVGLSGREAISTLFNFQLDLLATNDTPVAFESLLGQKISAKMSLPAGKERYFSGIVQRVSQGKRDETFTRYRIDMVPHFWLWTKKVQSRIFQHISVPDILKQVLTGLVVSFELQGKFYPRDYCVQYRESDFDFASRLMEEEGIYYYFTHEADGHKMIVANTPQSHLDVPAQPQVVYEEVTGGTREDMRITAWEKTQEVRSGKFTLWDQCFELPNQHLQAEKTIQDTVAAGKVTHKLNVADNVKLEIYDYPGAYAQRFDGVDRGGGDKPDDLKKIFEDNARTAQIRMQQEALPSLSIRGTSNCRQFVSGQRFALQRHFNADGDYVLTSVDHAAKLSGDFRSGQSTEFAYENQFTCIPLALPFRPPSTTPRPTVQGTQTAVVCGPTGEEIFCDKYGRVKVQFYWDRQGKKNADSSCWIRVSQPWAGKGFGTISLPRIGHEVVVDFLEGDPDQPLIVGSVYNAENMPPFPLPQDRKKTGIRTASVHGETQNYSGLAFLDEMGGEHVQLHSEKNLNLTTEQHNIFHVGGQSLHQFNNQHLKLVGHAPGASGSGGGGGSIGYATDSKHAAGTPGGPGFTLYNEYDFGIYSQQIFGVTTQALFGPKIELVVDPIGIFGANPTGMLVGQILGYGAALVGGHTEVIIGTSMGITIGAKIDILKGTKVDLTGNLGPGDKAIATVLALAAGAGMLLTGANVDSSGDPDPKSVIAGAGIATASIVTELALFMNNMKDEVADQKDSDKRLEAVEKVADKASTDASVVSARVDRALARLNKLEIDELMAEASHSFHITSGAEFTSANQIYLIAAAPKPDLVNPLPKPAAVAISAMGQFPALSAEDGRIALHASNEVQVLSGPNGVTVDLTSYLPGFGPVTVKAGDLGTISLEAGEKGQITVKAGDAGSIALETGLAGQVSIKTGAGGSISLEAGMGGSISLKVGTSSILLNAQGIEMDGIKHMENFKGPVQHGHLSRVFG